MNKIRFFIIILLTLSAGIMAYLVVNNDKYIALESGTLYPEDYKEIVPFQLTTNKNAAYTKDSFKDKWTLLFFGYTHCPDICPTSLVTLQQIKQKISGPVPADKIDYVFVSVDPDRDIPARLDEYVSYFDPDFKGVTGDLDEIKKLSSSLAAFFKIPDTKDENYLVAHSASIYLIGEDARPKVLFSYPHMPAKMADDLIRLYQR